jgi:HK97 gp10 family phage protein
MANVGITGGEDLIAALREFPAKMEIDVMAKSLREGAKVVQAAVIANTPKDSGDLRASVRIRRRTRKKSGYINLHVIVGNKEAWYAHLVEFGTKAHEIKPKKRKSLFLAGLLREIVFHPGAKPNAFMRRSFDETSGKAVQEIANATRKKIAQLEWRRSKGRI